MGMKGYALAAGMLAMMAGGLCGAAERPYDFRKRLEAVHEANRRDPAAQPAAVAAALVMYKDML